MLGPSLGDKIISGEKEVGPKSRRSANFLQRPRPGRLAAGRLRRAGRAGATDPLGGAGGGGGDARRNGGRVFCVGCEIRVCTFFENTVLGKEEPGMFNPYVNVLFFFGGGSAGGRWPAPFWTKGCQGYLKAHPSFGSAFLSLFRPGLLSSQTCARNELPLVAALQRPRSFSPRLTAPGFWKRT